MSQPVAVPKNIIITNDGRKYKKANFATTTSAVAAAAGAGVVTQFLAGELQHIMLIEKIDKAANKDSALYSAAIEPALEKAGLKSKNIKIIDAGEAKNKTHIEKLFALKKLEQKYSNSKNFLVKFYLKRKIEMCKSRISSLIKGKNACYGSTPSGGVIVLNKGKTAISAFHEMGHAMNRHFSSVGKALQKIGRKNKYVVGLLLATALFKRKKVDGEKTEGWFDKATTFVKNNVGKLVFISFVPTLIEEAMASIKGRKLAKSFFAPDKIKNITKHYTLAWLTYFSVAAITSLSCLVASKVRDEVAQPKEVTAIPNLKYKPSQNKFAIHQAK